MDSLSQLISQRVWKVNILTPCASSSGWIFYSAFFCRAETEDCIQELTFLTCFTCKMLIQLNLTFHLLLLTFNLLSFLRWSWIRCLSCSSSTLEFFTPTSNWRSRRVATLSGSLSVSHRGRSPRYTTTYPFSQEQINQAIKINTYIYLTFVVSCKTAYNEVMNGLFMIYVWWWRLVARMR